MSHDAHNKLGWIILAALMALLYWLLKGAKGTQLLSVSSTLAGKQVAGDTYLVDAATGETLKNFPSDPATGAPVFNSSSETTTPKGDFLLPLGSVIEGLTQFPLNPRAATCPDGYTLWKDESSGGYFCFPSGGL